MKTSTSVIKAVAKLLPALETSVIEAQRTPFFTLGLDVSTRSTGYAVLTPTGTNPELHVLCCGALTPWSCISDFAHCHTLKSSLCLLAGGLVRCGAIDLRRCDTLLSAAQSVAQELQTLKEEVVGELDQHLPASHFTFPGGPSDKSVLWEVGIEEFMKSFGGGRFHTKGLFKLAQLNGIVSYQCTGLFLAEPLEQKDPMESVAATSTKREPRLIMPNAIRSFHNLKVPKASKAKSAERVEAPNSKKNAKRKDIKKVVFERAAEELPAELVSILEVFLLSLIGIVQLPCKFLDL